MSVDYSSKLFYGIYSREEREDEKLSLLYHAMNEDIDTLYEYLEPEEGEESEERDEDGIPLFVTRYMEKVNAILKKYHLTLGQYNHHDANQYYLAVNESHHSSRNYELTLISQETIHEITSKQETYDTDLLLALQEIGWIPQELEWMSEPGWYLTGLIW